ncbi:MAG: SAM-dependent methyltransferase [Coraliomargarita sp.]
MNGSEKNVLELLRQRCTDGPISYRDMIEIALYADGCGYYRQERERVGRSPERDFYTAESLGNVFAKLVVSAAEDLLGAERASRSTFIEIAAEPGCCLLDNLENHPFAASQTIRQGERIQASGAVVLFANEWLDALPFHRLIFKGGIWRERGVSFDENGTLREVLLPELTPAVAAQASRLPKRTAEGYELDWPLEAEAALADLIQQDWTGLLLFFDYGKTWQALLESCPQGTARTYHKHQTSNNLLDLVGDKDITCDICWDPLEKTLQDSDCQQVTLESQEAFFVQRSSRAAEAIVSAAAWSFSEERQTLMELIHPAHMGQRFQALWALRNR